MGANYGSAGLPKAFCVRISDGSAAKSDGTNIYYDDRLNEIQKKCAVIHELVHVEWGPQHSAARALETMVRYETARRLLPALTFGAVCSNREESLAKSARKLGVTRQVLMDRAATLNDAGAATVGCDACQKCPATAARFNTTPPPSVNQWHEQVQWA